MRVLALVTEAFGGLGGIAQYNRDLCRAIASSDDAEVIVLPRWAGEGGEALPDRVTQLRAIGSKFAFGLAAYLQARPPIHIIFCGHMHLVPLAYLLARRFGAKFWLQTHGIEAWREPPPLRRWAAGRADLVTAVSRFTRGRFLAWAEVDPDRVRLLPPTYGERFAPGSRSETLLQRYALAGKRVLLTVGRLSPGERYKGQDRVIRLLPEIRQTVPNLAYVVAGDGDDRDRLSALARDLLVEDLVRFIGAVPASELPDLYRMAGVFVMPSTGEGFGIVFLEAAASGLRVIGGSKDGSVDALRDGTIGTLVDPDDREQLLGAVLAALAGEAADLTSLQVFQRRNFEEHVRAMMASIDMQCGV